MIRPTTATAGAAAVLLTTLVATASTSAAPVNRPLADELTRQFNQQELQQMQAAEAGAYSRADLLNGQQLSQPMAGPPPMSAPPPPMSAPPPMYAPPPQGAYPPQR